MGSRCVEGAQGTRHGRGRVVASRLGEGDTALGAPRGAHGVTIYLVCVSARSERCSIPGGVCLASSRAVCHAEEGRCRESSSCRELLVLCAHASVCISGGESWRVLAL